MSLQTLLSKHRYGLLNIKAPTKDDLDDYGLRTTKLRKPVPELFDKVIYQLRFPPIKGKYYKHYIYTVEKFMNYYNQATKQSQWQIASQLVDIHLSGKLLYMQLHPAMFHGFHNFKYSWLYNLLCAMRSYTINRRYLLGEIHTNNTVSTWSAGFEQFPKPLDLRAGSALADILYELVYDRSEYIHKRSL